MVVFGLSHGAMTIPCENWLLFHAAESVRFSGQFHTILQVRITVFLKGLEHIRFRRVHLDPSLLDLALEVLALDQIGNLVVVVLAALLLLSALFLL